ncbi:MAG: IPT/TIG domain-containing protein [Deltaproteobacteria bacterium]|nr:IPT/TIG domain-containing protein [Deltaproteobacteria bacterium]
MKILSPGKVILSLLSMGTLGLWIGGCSHGDGKFAGSVPETPATVTADITLSLPISTTSSSAPRSTSLKTAALSLSRTSALKAGEVTDDLVTATVEISDSTTGEVVERDCTVLSVEVDPEDSAAIQVEFDCFDGEFEGDPTIDVGIVDPETGITSGVVGLLDVGVIKDPTKKTVLPITPDTSAERSITNAIKQQANLPRSAQPRLEIAKLLATTGLSVTDIVARGDLVSSDVLKPFLSIAEQWRSYDSKFVDASNLGQRVYLDAVRTNGDQAKKNIDKFAFDQAINTGGMTPESFRNLRQAGNAAFTAGIGGGGGFGDILRLGASIEASMTDKYTQLVEGGWQDDSTMFSMYSDVLTTGLSFTRSEDFNTYDSLTNVSGSQWQNAMKDKIAEITGVTWMINTTALCNDIKTVSCEALRSEVGVGSNVSCQLLRDDYHRNCDYEKIIAVNPNFCSSKALGCGGWVDPALMAEIGSKLAGFSYASEATGSYLQVAVTAWGVEDSFAQYDFSNFTSMVNFAQTAEATQFAVTAQALKENFETGIYAGFDRSLYYETPTVSVTVNNTQITVVNAVPETHSLSFVGLTDGDTKVVGESIDVCVVGPALQPPVTMWFENVNNVADSVRVTMSGISISGCTAGGLRGTIPLSLVIGAPYRFCIQSSSISKECTSNRFIAGAPPQQQQLVSGPTITSLSASSGVVGASVTITGTGFASGAVVQLGQSTATSVFVDSTHMTFTVPNVSAGTYPVTVIVSAKSSLPASFQVTVQQQPPPSVLQTLKVVPSNDSTCTNAAMVSLTSGATYGLCTTSQFPFGQGSYKFNSTNLLFTQSTQTFGTFVAPPEATGKIQVTINNVTSETVNLTIGAAPPPASPTITTVNPLSGAPGSLVTVTGTNFTGTPLVQFAGNPAQVVSTLVNGTTITFTVPNVPAAVYGVNVTVAGVTLNGGNFTVPPPAPTINANNGVAPKSPTTANKGNPTSPGTVITVAGANFGASAGQGSTLQLIPSPGPGPAALIDLSYVTSWSDGQIQFTAGEQIGNQAYNVRVTTGGGTVTSAETLTLVSRGTVVSRGVTVNNATSGQLVSIPDHWSSAGNFTAEAWVKITRNDGPVRIFGQWWVDNAWQIKVQGDGSTSVELSANGSGPVGEFNATAASAWLGNFTNDVRWNHIAFVHNTGTGTILVCTNGTCASIPDTAIFDAVTAPLKLAVTDANPGDAVFDELRVSESARYSGNFTPQRFPYVADAATKALYHFDNNNADATGGAAATLEGGAAYTAAGGGYAYNSTLVQAVSLVGVAIANGATVFKGNPPGPNDTSGQGGKGTSFVVIAQTGSFGTNAALIDVAVVPMNNDCTASTGAPVSVAYDANQLMSTAIPVVIPSSVSHVGKFSMRVRAVAGIFETIATTPASQCMNLQASNP